MVNLQIFLNFLRITRVRIPGKSILSEIVSVFQTLGFEPREAPDGDRQLRAAPWLRRGSPSCFSEQASYILKAYKACLGLNINIKILYLNRRPLDRKWGSRDSLAHGASAIATALTALTAQNRRPVNRLFQLRIYFSSGGVHVRARMGRARAWCGMKSAKALNNYALARNCGGQN